MASELGELYLVLRAVTAPMTKGFAESGAAGESLATKLKSGPMSAMANFGKIVSEGAVGVAAASVKMAGDFQASMVRLKTSAGESGDFIGGNLTGNLKLVSNGILKMATDTATSTKELSSGMYMIESAGFHGAAGLKVLQAAAEGAKAEGADLGTVGNALTTMMKDYHLQASQSVPAMNQLIATVAQGKMRMDDLAGALHSVLPIAAAAKLSYAQVGGAIATMTSHGVSAELATQHLSNMIRNLLKPSNIASQEMGRLGLSANDVSKNLGTRGLTGTLNLLMTAIMQHTKGGMVLVSAFNASTEAAQAEQQMLSSMPPKLRELAQAYASGKISVSDWRQSIKALPADQANLASQFAAAENRSHGFTQALKNNRPAAETLSSALSKVTGGAVGLETALQLTGENAVDFNRAVKNIGDASKKTGDHVENWKQIQSTFNYQMQRLKEVIEVTAIKIGSVLIPIIMKAVTWFQHHSTVAKALAMIIAGILTASVITFAARSVISIARTAVEFGKLGVSAAKAGVSVAKAVVSFGSSSASTLAELGPKIASIASTARSGAVAAGELAAQWTKAGVAASVAAVRFVAVKTAQVAIRVATLAWTAAQWLLDAAMDANPIGLVIVAIAALVAAVIYAYTHFTWFRNIVNDVFNWLKNAVVFVVDFVKNHWQLILGVITGPIGLAVVLIIKYWGDIKHWFQDGVNAVKNILNWFAGLGNMFKNWLMYVIIGVLEFQFKLYDLIGSIPGKIWNLLSGLGSDMLQLGKNIIIGLWNGLVSLSSWLYNQIISLIRNIIPGPIAKVLGIASPSKLMHSFGQMVGHGLANGIKSTYGVVADAASGLADTVASNSAIGGLPATSAGSGSGLATTAGALAAGASRGGATYVTNVNVTVQGSVRADQDLYDTIQKMALVHNRRNPTNGLSLAR